MELKISSGDFKITRPSELGRYIRTFNYNRIGRYVDSIADRGIGEQQDVANNDVNDTVGFTHPGEFGAR